jgi:hypothetical protein
MQLYDIEVQRGETTIVAMRSVELHSSEALWLKIVELAQQPFATDCRIRVTDQAGEIGMAAARLSAAA